MKKYLMRGGISPLDVFSPEKVIKENLIGANSGNLLYAFGVYRTLMTEDVQIDMDYYGVERRYTDQDIDRINEEYDAYICPLADAFRDAFAGKLLKYAHFFTRLKIPCYVIGLGVRAPYEADITQGFPFDEEARKFVKAVLGKSAMLGLRGEKTAEYLKYLGFKEDVDFRAIGCPSMYTFGRELPQRALRFDSAGNLAQDMKLSVNMSSITPEPVLQFLFSQMDRFPEHYCVEQNEAELRLLYNGIRYVTHQKGKDTLLPLEYTHPLLAQDRYKVFINVKTWFDFLRGMDMSVGSKLHGNVAGVLSGCPTLFITLDTRMKELVDYHAFPAIPFHQIRPEDRLEDLMAKVDMQSHIKKQGENFDRFVDFLDRNELPHIYQNDRQRKDAPVDALMAKNQYQQVQSILKCTPEEAVRRFNVYNEQSRKTIASLKKEKAELKKMFPDSLRSLLEFAWTNKIIGKHKG